MFMHFTLKAFSHYWGSRNEWGSQLLGRFLPIINVLIISSHSHVSCNDAKSLQTATSNSAQSLKLEGAMIESVRVGIRWNLRPRPIFEARKFNVFGIGCNFRLSPLFEARESRDTDTQCVGSSCNCEDLKPEGP